MGRERPGGSRGALHNALEEALAVHVGSHHQRSMPPPRRSSTRVDDRFTHGFHTWPAAMHPEAAGRLLALLPPGPVADPFCGGGTVLVEAMLQGRPATGRDLSPVAILVSRARTRLADDDTLTALRSGARKATATARAAREDPPETLLVPLRSWYEPHVLWELESLRRSCLASDPTVRELMLACFSSILVKVSWRVSDTVAKKEPGHRPPGTTAVLFHKKARELARRLVDLRDNIPPGIPEPSIHEGDARQFKHPVPLAGVVTSPPYPGIYDYLPMQHLRHVWLGCDVGDSSGLEMGSRRAFMADQTRARALWRRDSERWMARAREAVAPDGLLAVVMGDGHVAGRTMGTAEPLMEAGAASGWALLDRVKAARPGPPGKPRFEHILLFGGA